MDSKEYFKTKLGRNDADPSTSSHKNDTVHVKISREIQVVETSAVAVHDQVDEKQLKRKRREEKKAEKEILKKQKMGV